MHPATLLGGPLYILRIHPQIDELRCFAQANPPGIPEMIRLFEAQDPALATIVKANMEGFISILFEPLEARELEVHAPHEHPLTWGDRTGNACNVCGVCDDEGETMFFFCEACDCALPLAPSPSPPPPLPFVTPPLLFTPRG